MNNENTAAIDNAPYLSQKEVDNLRMQFATNGENIDNAPYLSQADSMKMAVENYELNKEAVDNLWVQLVTIEKRKGTSKHGYYSVK